MNIWTWVHEIERRAYANSDEHRIKMVALFYEAMAISDDDPDLALNLLSQSRAIAQQLGELWWIQLVNHWELQYRIYDKRDLSNILELAVQSTVETRKPHYAEFPQRICLHEDLIRVYLNQDPLGHIEMIQTALDYMDSQLNPHVECFLCFQQLKIAFKIVQGDLEAASAGAHKLLDYAANNSFHLCHAYQYLCEVAYHQKDWAAIGQWSYLGESLAKTQYSNADQVIEFLMWQAVYERHSGQESQALKHFRLAASRAEDYKGGLSRGYFDAICAFHELGGDLDKALISREKFLATLVNTAHYYDECDCLIDMVRLRKAFDLPLTSLIEQLEQELQNLKDPKPMRDKLDRILDGEN